ncbi:MAG: signal recognition particle protein [Planctomycetota bacterium]|jgi:signal recognition particle subunit SRP54|nr:signal recognition particle protein [Planctomycetota bacterium]MEC7717914.1 signal recognition particle protein [Planctomycetota bacterium]MEE3074273.1 signal recognition particle protein [Planctomycetota bacterium]
MFESLQDGLRDAFKSISGRAKLTESNMRDGLKMVENALLEADVSYTVVQDFMKQVSQRALGEKVLGSLSPDQQLVGIVNEELLSLLGKGEEGIRLKPGTNVLMMCGLQGSGKTTTCGKLTQLLKRQNLKCMLVAADLQRPAAIQQLHVLGDQLGVAVYSEPGEKDPVSVCRNAVAKAKQDEIEVVILDTAGRLAIDQELMDQLVLIDKRVQPDQVFLVVDGMTGQDAVNSAAAFNEALTLDGVIMTKLDGDARGGALLSVRHVTGVPLKFIGTGEQMDALEPFRPDGMASRILGMGDVVALVDEAQKLIDTKEREALEQKMASGQFTLDDFRDQIDKIARPGLMQKMMGLLPGGAQLKDAMNQVDTGQETRRLIGMIDSMTAVERKNPKVIDISRRKRIAAGAGVQPQQVNELIKQFEMMKPMFTSMAQPGSMKEKMAMVQEMQQQMANPGRTMKTKKGTGKRLSASDKKKQKKEREKMLRDRLRKKKKNR